MLTPRRLTDRLRVMFDEWALRLAHASPERNPKIFAVLAGMAVFLLPTATGAQPLPGSLASHAAFGQLSTAATVLGCILCDLGIITPARWRDLGLVIEIGGCVFLAAGTLFYAAALYVYALPAQRAFVFGPMVGIGVGSLLRAGQIGLYVRGRRLARLPESGSTREQR